MPYEFDAFGIPLDESRDRFDDTVGTMVRLWQEESVDSDSRFFSFADATILPRPVQAPHPPVWVAAVRTEASFVAAGERGYGLLITPSLSPLPQMASLVAKYRANFRPAHPGDEARVLASLPVFVGETDEHALSVGDPLLAHYLEIWARSADSWDERRSGDYVGYTGMGKGIRSVPVEYLRTVGGAVVGGPQTVVDRISAIQATIGADGYLWQVDFGGVDHRTARTSVERLCTDVIPNLDLFV
jgi:alkanesulfonate monooxygenase SsuD/methylene tetrahydromethanopterin reductase-like flavin-dependent oxidoreductase (luciferase family)